MDNFDLKKFVSEKTLLNENAPGYDTRKTGESLPTLESVKAAYEAEGKKEEKLNEISFDAIDRMEGLANIQNLKIMKDMLRMLSTDWMQDGFEKGDIAEYISSLIDENQPTINEELYDFVKNIKSAVGSNASLNNIEYYLGREINYEERQALINAGVLRQVSDERYGSQYKKIQRRKY